MELHEFEVGYLGPGAQGQGNTIARGHRRVRRLGEDLTEAPGGQDDHRRECGADTIALALAHDVQRHALGSPVFVAQQVQDERTLDELDAGVEGDRSHERPRDLGAGGIATGMGDAIAMVSALASQSDGSGGIQVKVGTEANEIADAVGALGDERLHRIDIAQTGARDEGVVQMLLGGVVVRERRGDAALRPPGGSLLDATLRHKQDSAAGAAGMECGGESRHSRAHDDHIAACGPPGAGCEEGTHAPPPSSTGALSMSLVPSRYTATTNRPAPRWGASPSSWSVTAT